jgi:tRNA (cmo5U34)-methyltransferase
MQPDPQASPPDWSEVDSESFLDLGRFFVPEREEQIDTLCSLIPPPRSSGGPAHLVELCCGEGLLSAALLDRFPTATVHAYDGSPTMLATASANLAHHGERFDARLFDLAERSWRRFPWPVHAFVSSLAVHHLDGAEKAALFADLVAALAPGGILLLADLVLPVHAQGHALAARRWDEEVRRRAQALAGDLAPVEIFRRERWNYYTDPDPGDRPSPLFDQLRWLREAGCERVDVFWMKAGHTIFGGLKGG